LAGDRVHHTTAADLVTRTNKAAVEGRWATTMRFWNNSSQNAELGDSSCASSAGAGRSDRTA
jgi:hypothetical protein